jgi:hypothetical protein
MVVAINPTIVATTVIVISYTITITAMPMTPVKTTTRDGATSWRRCKTQKKFCEKING